MITFKISDKGLDYEQSHAQDQACQKKHVRDVQEPGLAGDDPAQKIEVDTEILVDQVVGSQELFHIFQVITDRDLPVVCERKLYGALHDQELFQMQVGACGEDRHADGCQGEDQEDEKRDVIAEVHDLIGIPEIERSGKKPQHTGDQQGIDTDDQVGFAVHDADQGDLSPDGDTEERLFAPSFGITSWQGNFNVVHDQTFCRKE